MPATHDQRPGRARAALVALAIALAFYALTIAVSLSGVRSHGRFAYDQVNYHEPTVRDFARTFPAADFSNYWSATTPLYHYTLAAVAQLNESRTALMAAGGLYSLALVALLLYATARRAGIPLGLALTLPVACSFHIFTQAVWMLPDNAAWLGVLAMLLLVLRPRFDALTLTAGALTLALLVSTRQIHAWAGGLLLVAAWLGSGPAPHRPAALLVPTPQRLRRCALAALAILPALAITLAFVALWGGLVVPRYQGKYHGFNPATPAFFLFLVGALAPFYAGAILPAAARAWQRHRALLATVVTLAVLAAVLPETTYSVEDGRYSGFWNLVKRTPTIAGHTSALILALAPVGALALLALCTAAPPRSGWILAAAAAGFCTVQTLSPELWHRYHEPMIFLLLTLGSAEAVRQRRAAAGGSRDPRPLAALTIAGPVLLALLYTVITARIILRPHPVGPAADGAYHLADDAEPVHPR